MEPELVEGLSHCHIRAQEVVETIPARLVVYTDATFAKVTRELETRCCVECGAEYDIEKVETETRCFMCRNVRRHCVHCGQDFLLKNETFRTNETVTCPFCGGLNEGCGKRGEVTRFSESSKRRLMHLLNKVQRDVSKVNFVTLTFPDEYFPFISEPEDWKERLRLFEWRFRRAFPAAAFVWRLEVETRKSGEHVGSHFPHFHLLVFNVELPDLRPFVASVWNEVAGCGSEEHFKVHSHRKAVTPVLSRRGVMSYAAKAVGSVMSRELAKSLQAKGESVGRWWGVAVRKVFETFLAIAEEFELTDSDAVSLIRTFRKYIQKQVLLRWLKAGRKWKKPRKAGFQWRSVVVFLNGEWLRASVPRLLNSTGTWCYTATGRRYDVPFMEFLMKKEGNYVT